MTEISTKSVDESWLNILYGRLLLRDVFGKMVPGAVLLAAILGPYLPALKVMAAAIDSWFGFLAAALFAGASWLAGFAVQWFGVRAGYIRYFPRALDLVSWQTIRTKHMDDLKGEKISIPDMTQTKEQRWQEFQRDFNSVPKMMAQIQQSERFVVIKEACGNGYVALELAVTILLVRLFTNGAMLYATGADLPATDLSPTDLAKFVITLSATLGVAISLREMHFEHVDRQFVYWIGMMKSLRSVPNDGDPQ